MLKLSCRLQVRSLEQARKGMQQAVVSHRREACNAQELVRFVTALIVCYCAYLSGPAKHAHDAMQSMSMNLFFFKTLSSCSLL